MRKLVAEMIYFSIRMCYNDCVIEYTSRRKLI